MYNSTPTVSVVIPLYNKGKYISRALESVFSQTYTDYEAIVVDDGSTDDGCEVVRRFSAQRLRLIQQTNKGPGAARNTAIRESGGKLLAFLDADDEWMPQFLERSINKLRASPDCDLTACSYFLGEKRTDISGILRKRGINNGPWQLRSDSSLEELQAGRCIFNSWAILCKRQVVEKCGGFRAGNHCNYGEDTYLWLQVVLRSKVFRILEPLVWYHSEVSALGPGRQDEKPVQSFLIDPDPIRMSCPYRHRRLLELFLARFALATAHECVGADGGGEKVDYLRKAFPLMKKFRWEYTKLRIKTVMPEIIPFVKSVKKSFYNFAIFKQTINKA